MNRWIVRLVMVLLGVLLLPYTCPAPLVYRPGEGWSYEPIGGGKWERTRAKDQLEVAEQAFDKKEYRLTKKAARRVVKQWPYSDYAPKAQYLLARSYEMRHMDERAFKEYQKLLEKYPKAENYIEVSQRQFDIANRFLAGQWFHLWGYIPFGRSMSKTAEMYEKIIKLGVQGELAPLAQMKIGEARFKEREYGKSVKAYETAADRYNHLEKVAADARYKIGMVYRKQAEKADYDQSIAGKAIAAFSDFNALYPNDTRTAETQKYIKEMRSEQALGAFHTAKFYEKRHRWSGALIYYNEVLLKDPESQQAQEAKLKIEAIKKRTEAKRKN